MAELETGLLPGAGEHLDSMDVPEAILMVDASRLVAGPETKTVPSLTGGAWYSSSQS